jgi:uncharacterized membrane protein YbhN (UPF0104 family)
MKRAGWAWARLLGAAVLLGVLIWRVGTGPFVGGIKTVSGWSLLAALAITAVTTLCSAVRWRAVARALGVPLSLTDAITGYYRSQFLNSALPGGAAGGRVGTRRRTAGAGGPGHGGVADTAFARPLVDAVGGRRGGRWRRLAGRRRPSPSVARAVVAFAPRGRGPGRFAGAAGPRGVGAVWPVVTGTSAITVIGYGSVFIIAARTSVPSVSLGRLLPLTMLVLLAMTVPLSIAGWGPREGVAAWAFAAAGLGLDHGIAAATAYGVLSFGATLPGAVVLFAGWLRRRSVAKRCVHPLSLKHAVHG